MTASLAARRPLVFAALAVAAVAAEYAVVASRGFALHPTGFSAAVIFDLVVGLPLAWWLLVVRPGAARPRSLVPVALAGLAVAAALLPGQRGLLRGLRFLGHSRRGGARGRGPAALLRRPGRLAGPPARRARRRSRGAPRSQRAGDPRARALLLALPAGARDALGAPPQRVDRRLRGGALHVAARDGRSAPLDRTLVALRGLGRDRAGRLRRGVAARGPPRAAAPRGERRGRAAADPHRTAPRGGRAARVDRVRGGRRGARSGAAGRAGRAGAHAPPTRAGRNPFTVREGAERECARTPNRRSRCAAGAARLVTASRKPQADRATRRPRPAGPSAGRRPRSRAAW